MTSASAQQDGWVDLENSGRARGWIDIFENDGSKVHVKGWVLDPYRPLESVRLFVGDILLGSAWLEAHPGVVGAFPAIRHSEFSGFDLTIDSHLAAAPSYDVHVEGLVGGEVVTHFDWALAPAAPDRVLPPAHLRMRVAGNEDPLVYAQGFQSTSNLLAAVKAHRPLETVGSLLDWGCGPGRCSSHLIRLLPQARVYGCDIDHEAVAWAAANLTGGHFSGSGPFPPLPFDDRQFDVVLGASVMTHLKREVQPKWLQEIRRVLKPGGIFVASVHGPFAAHFLGFLPQLVTDRMMDGILDQTLEGVAPAGYYRAVFQMPDYTREEWSKEFEILDYLGAGLMCFQDLVVMRKRV